MSVVFIVTTIAKYNNSGISVAQHPLLYLWIFIVIVQAVIAWMRFNEISIFALEGGDLVSAVSLFSCISV